ncbi:hypothetical protein Poli38472_002866 [Pythium oligandrum]|uniref:GOLD domain-containing protein n=1 Tax=Pythium oligandrum TaxID=41045 RepID=A0A8K1FC92_PYTOL|nr:hypothetical protein Poli38472_002866 [Pythium oligandrum]|eukprot:TMW56941.1 hypothetical protein Poli38472_002866 [Pythium oligandrum]
MPRAHLLLLLAVGVALHALVTPVTASRFTFKMPSRQEECFLEEVDARSSSNKLLFRFGILEPNYYDLIDVTIKAPSWKVVESWNRTQGDHVTAPVRETGLYHLCFRKRAGASKEITVYYSFDFISTGSVHVTLYPNLAATLDKVTPDSTMYTTMMLGTVEGAPHKIGIVDYSLNGISPGVVRGNTRVQLLLSVEFVSKPKVEVSIARYPNRIEYPLSWDSMGNYVKYEYRQRVFDTAIAELGTHVAFDVTELVTEALKNKKPTITFSLHVNEDAEATISGMSYTTPDYYPKIVFEDMGLDLMREVAFFKERVFTLRGDITYIKQKERASRNAAESANSRVKWLSMLTNVVLVSIALAQVMYIRTMLESSY